MASIQPTGLNPLVAQLLKEEEPIQNWAQGANHLAKALFRGLELRDQKQRENQLSQALLGLPGLGAQSATPPSGMPTPAPDIPAGRPSPMPPAQTGPMPGNLPSAPPANDPTMTISPRQIAMANAPQGGAPASFNDRFSAAMPAAPGAQPVPTAPAAPPAQPPAPPAPPASQATPPAQQPTASRQFDPVIQSQIQALVKTKQYDAALSLYNKERERLTKPPDFGVIGKDEYGNEQRGWIDPQSRTTTPDGSRPSIPNFVDTKKLRDEVRDLPSYKNIAQAAPVYKSMFEAAGRDNRAADVNMIYGMAKIMDPTSVVRESEMTIAQAVSTLPQHLQSTIMSQLQGTERLSPEVRAAIMQEAHSRISAYQGMFDQDMGMYRGIAESGRFDPSHVIPKFGPFDQFKAPQAPASGAPVSPGAPAAQTQEGGWQTLPNGVRIRPKQ